MTKTTNSDQPEFAIVLVNCDLAEGASGYLTGVRTHGHQLVTFRSVDDALAYLPVYGAWARGHFERDKNWARYNAHRRAQVFLVVRAAAVPGIEERREFPRTWAARVLHADMDLT